MLGTIEETRPLFTSPGIISLTKVMLLQCVEYVACTREARSADKSREMDCGNCGTRYLVRCRDLLTVRLAFIILLLYYCLAR
jgi:DNA-directed RNA polymerase subunit RPC12/RpoP